jgi:hypothetical protein
MRRLMGLGMAILLTGSLGACSGDSWKEEVLLHDGQTMTVQRSLSYKGRGEIGQGTPIGTHELRFKPPGAADSLTWTSEYDATIGRTSFHVVAVHVKDGKAYVVASPNLCLSYNKWGRPNPPYVIFKRDGAQWSRVEIKDLPAEFKTVNLVQSYRSDAAKLAQLGKVSATQIAGFNVGVQPPEFKTILRERINYDPGCPVLEFYKGSWIGPGDSIGRRMLDAGSK